MKIALCQFQMTWEDKNSSLKHAEEMIKQASEADIILFPEMSLTGFSMCIEKTKEYHKETVSKMKQLAKQYQIAIGMGWVEACGEKAKNHYTIVDCEGNILTDYVKIHPFQYGGEDEYFVGGNEVNTFTFMGHSCSISICYDLRFPEVFQAVSNQCDLIIVPANWPEKRKNHWNCLLQARAIENQVFILGINCVGEIGKQFYSGNSQVIAPDGRIIETLEGKEGILFTNVLDEASQIRKNFPMKNDRKNKLYRDFYEKM